MAPVTTISSSQELIAIQDFLRSGQLAANLSAQEKFWFRKKANKFVLIENELYYKEGELRKKYIPPFNTEQARTACK